MTNRTLTNAPPAKSKPTAQTVLKALGFATYQAYFIAQGQFMANAPCEAMHTPWTESEISKFHSVLDDIFV